jgi:hypothetical protein
MKKIISTLASLFIAVFVMAQAPDVMNYQAVARNSSGQALASQAIKVRLSITKNAVVLYSETRQAVTNALGLFNVQIGSGGAISTTGSFSGINWQNNPNTHYLKVELDVNNGTTFTDMGSQALVSVPYSFHSKTADDVTVVKNIAGRPVDQTTTPTEGSRLSWNGTSWTPIKKDSIHIFNVLPHPTSISVSADWEFVQHPNFAPTFTVTGSERIIANLGGAVSCESANPTLISYAVCYQSLVAGSPITPFYSGDPLRFVLQPSANPGSSAISNIHASGAITLPAGSYRIGLAVKHTGDAPITPHRKVQGTIEIRY